MKMFAISMYEEMIVEYISMMNNINYLYLNLNLFSKRYILNSPSAN